MGLRTAILGVLLACLLVADAERSQKRQKPSERSKLQRENGAKDVSWFKVDEDNSDACQDVIEADQTVETGPPADKCQEDDERFCFCGKKGTKETANWKFLCGECRENKPFSFKIEKPERGAGRGRGRFSGCSDGKRPTCADDSKPQKPEEEGGLPKCEDGTTPLC